LQNVYLLIRSTCIFTLCCNLRLAGDEIFWCTGFGMDFFCARNLSHQICTLLH